MKKFALFIFLSLFSYSSNCQTIDSAFIEKYIVNKYKMKSFHNITAEFTAQKKEGDLL